MFENASESFRKANPQLEYSSDPRSGPNPILHSPPAKRGKMNKTEAEFALMLEAQKRNGEILRYEFEGITLRWADMRYTPDFVVFCAPMSDLPTSIITPIKLFEVKGAHIWDRDIVRFKGARAYWPEFAFEMWQKTKAGWTLKF
jgi:hypothetical protein